ncbi:hypothetical protein C8Q74DRAFT_190394 [Fomes fomentarius]|nr:hypothetical protein C8Q74DRAFT_190394 [Fomes fomentarius]
MPVLVLLQRTNYLRPHADALAASCARSLAQTRSRRTRLLVWNALALSVVKKGQKRRNTYQLADRRRCEEEQEETVSTRSQSTPIGWDSPQSLDSRAGSGAGSCFRVSVFPVGRRDDITPGNTNARYMRSDRDSVKSTSLSPPHAQCRRPRKGRRACESLSVSYAIWTASLTREQGVQGVRDECED